MTRESEDILANEGPPHQAFTTLPAEMQFQKDAQNARLTRRNAPHNLAFHFYKPVARRQRADLSHNRDRKCPTIETDSFYFWRNFSDGGEGWH
jgi:hypothetical protein